MPHHADHLTPIPGQPHCFCFQLSPPTWCRFSLYSLLGSRPSATIITLFFPKKILQRNEEEDDEDEKAVRPAASHPPPTRPRAHRLCFQAFRTSFSLLFRMLATEKMKMCL